MRSPQLGRSSLIFFLARQEISLTSYQAVQDLDYSILAATSVLGDLAGKYPKAQASRDALAQMGVATLKMCLAATDLEHSVPQTRGATLGRTHQDSSQSNDATGQRLLGWSTFKESDRWYEPELTGYPDPQSTIVGYWKDRYSSEDVSKNLESDNLIQDPIQGSLRPASVGYRDELCDIKPPIEWLENKPSLALPCLLSPDLSSKSYEQAQIRGDNYSTSSDFDLLSFNFGSSKSASDVLDHITDCTSPDVNVGLEDARGDIHQDVLEAYLVGWANSGSPTDH